MAVHQDETAILRRFGRPTRIARSARTVATFSTGAFFQMKGGTLACRSVN